MSEPSPYTYIDGPPTALYRFFDEAGNLLYVGITSKGPSRFAQHADSKSWWFQVSEIQVEHHGTRREALAAERVAIASEAPLHNIIVAPVTRPDDDRRTTPFRPPDGLTEAIDSTLSYGQSRNAWIVEACQMRLEGGRPRPTTVQAESTGPAQPERVVDLMANLETSVAAAKAARARHPQHRTPVASFDPDEVTGE